MQRLNYFLLEEKAWESKFFDKRFGSLRFLNKSIPVDNSIQVLKAELTDILLYANENYDLIDFHIPSSLFSLIAICEDFNFRLIDSQIVFKTLLEEATILYQEFNLSFDELNLRMFEEKDFTQIISLTKKNLIENPVFVSRFKNLDYFKEGDALKYFEQYITNMVTNQDSFCNVLVDANNKIEGYFIYERKGILNNLTIYKGILTLLTEKYRGKGTHLAMQYHLLKQFKEQRFYIENATQLSNFPVIKNHLKSKRTLEEIIFILMWKNPYRSI